MKRVFILLISALICFEAGAWAKYPDEGIVLLSMKHLTAEAKSVVQSYLGDSYGDDVNYLSTLERKKTAKHTKEIHYLHLDKDLKPMAVQGDDALVALERAIEVVRLRNQHSRGEVITAFRTIINLMCDIHEISNVRIENFPYSQKDFVMQCYGGDYGKRKVISKIRWSRFWSSYPNWHTGFSGDLWAEDMELCLGSKYAEFSEGALRDWVAQIGGTAAQLYSRITPEYQMTRRERNELEMLNYEMMTRAGYRMSKLFNEICK